VHFFRTVAWQPPAIDATEGLKITFRWHGNYCGPGWSDGKYQVSVANGKIKPIDKLDAACRDHDTAYANNQDLTAADFKLAKEAWKAGGWKGYFTALGISLQGATRKLGLLRSNHLSRIPPPNNPEFQREIIKLKKSLKPTELIMPRNGKKTTSRKSRARSSFAVARQRRTARPRRLRLPRRRTRVGNRSFAAPAAVGIQSRARPPRQERTHTNDVILAGKEQIAVVTVQPTNQVGDILLQLDIAPQNFPGTRLGTLASLYERYDALHSVFTFRPSTSVQVPGQLMMAFDPDTVDSLSNGAINVSRAEDNGGKTFSPWIPTSISYRRENKQPSLFTSNGNDPRLMNMGKLYIVSNAVWSTISAGTTIGTVEWNYKIKFYKPTIESGNMNTTNCATCTAQAPTPAAPFGTSLNNDASNDFNFQYVDGLHLKIPVASGGLYYMTEVTQGSAITQRTGLSWGGCNIITILQDAFTSTTMTCIVLVQATGSLISVSATAPTATTITSVRFIATRTRNLSAPAPSYRSLVDKVTDLSKKFEQLLAINKTEQQADNNTQVELEALKAQLWRQLGKAP